VPRSQNEEQIVFSTCPHAKRTKLDPNLPAYTEINTKRIMDLEERPEARELPEEDTGTLS
jgi:hypothetical protein